MLTCQRWLYQGHSISVVPRRLGFSVSSLLLTSLLLTSQCFAQVPHLIRYQGQAIDSKGVPLEGPYTLTFRLYDAETAGNLIWQEPQPNVPVSKGHFSVLLGQGAGTPLNVDWSKPCWLAVQVNAEPELAPRQQITSVPLAVRAESAEQLTQTITPAQISPQGSGSSLDADTVDGKHATDLLNRANHIGTQPSSTITGTFPPSAVSPQGSGSGLDADTLDGKHASQLAPYGFGGAFTHYGWTGSACLNANPFTGGCSCPSGFSPMYLDVTEGRALGICVR